MNSITFTLQNVFYVFLGAGVGGAFRFGVNSIAGHLHFFTFSFSTLIVNVVGASLAGVASTLLSTEARAPFFLFIVTGFLGGFTTFSAFTFEGVKLLEVNPLLAVAHTLLHVCGCLLAFYFGARLTQFVI